MSKYRLVEFEANQIEVKDSDGTRDNLYEENKSIMKSNKSTVKPVQLLSSSKHEKQKQLKKQLGRQIACSSFDSKMSTESYLMRKNEKLEMNIVSKIRKFDENNPIKDYVLPRSEAYIGGILPQDIIDIQVIGSNSNDKQVGKRIKPDLLYSVNRKNENERLLFAKEFCFPNGIENRDCLKEETIIAFSMSGNESNVEVSYSEIYCLGLCY